MFGKQRSGRESGADILQHELAAERAASLGRVGFKMEIALNRLKAFDAGQQQDQSRDELVKAAAKAVWMFFVQRESCGLKDQRAHSWEMPRPTACCP